MVPQAGGTLGDGDSVPQERKTKAPYPALCWILTQFATQAHAKHPGELIMWLDRKSHLQKDGIACLEHWRKELIKIQAFAFVLFPAYIVYYTCSENIAFN